MSAEFEPVAPALVPTTPWESRTGPAEPVSRGWTARFSLVWFGYWMANRVPERQGGMISSAIYGPQARRRRGDRGVLDPGPVVVARLCTYSGGADRLHPPVSGQVPRDVFRRGARGEPAFHRHVLGRL